MNEIDSGTQFDFTYAPGTSVEQIIGFEMAGEIWSSYLKDDVAVRIYVESTDQLPENVVGAALPGKKQEVDYKKLRKEMAKGPMSDNDILAFNNLPVDKEFDIIVQGQEIDKTKKIKLTNANAKALDLLKDKDDVLDGYILVNDLTGSSTAGWDYDALRNEGISSKNLDFVSVAMHEIGHVLGFVSGIDDEGWLDVLSEATEKAAEKDEELKLKDFKFASPLDLYRYTSESAAERELLDLSLGGNPFFSIDGGNTRLGNFANGEYTDYGGDGYQASHWEQNSSQGIMNPILPMGERRDISALDVTAMDVIGWDVNTSEYPSWQEMYDTAIANSHTAVVRDRSEDVEEMIEDSKYKGRRSSKKSSSRSSLGGSYSFQVGYWQYTTFDAVDTSDAIIEESAVEAELGTDVTIEESAIITEFDSDINVDELVIVDELDSNTITEVFPNLELDDNESSATESTENNNEIDIAGVSTNEQNEDFLSSEEVEETSDDILYYQSPLLPGVLIPIEFN